MYQSRVISSKRSVTFLCTLSVIIWLWTPVAALAQPNEGSVGVVGSALDSPLVGATPDSLGQGSVVVTQIQSRSFWSLWLFSDFFQQDLAHFMILDNHDVTAIPAFTSAALVGVDIVYPSPQVYRTLVPSDGSRSSITPESPDFAHSLESSQSAEPVPVHLRFGDRGSVHC